MKTRFILAFTALLLVAHPVLADTVSAVGSWNPWVTPTQRNSIPFASAAVQPFWDNVSKDGTQDGFGNNCNVGFWVSAQGMCDAVSFYSADFYQNSPGATGAYLGTGTGDGATFTMVDTPGDVTSVSAGVGVSALSGDVPTRGTTEFGWVPVGTNDFHPMLNGGNPLVGVPVPSGEYEFYIRVYDLRPTANGQPTTYRTSELDALGRSHFAIFDLGAGDYAIGIEDKLGQVGTNWSDYDYNDLVVLVHSEQVPEPASLLLMGVGLVGGAAMLRRRKKV